MALSGNFTTSAYSGRYYRLSWTGTQEVANNRTKISWTLSCAGGSSAWYAERDLELQINNSVEYTKTARVERYAGTIASGTCYIGHNTDGTKSFSASLKVAVYGNSINCTGSKTFTLDTIPRQATITSAPNFTSAQSPVISYSNPAGNSVTTLQACISLDGSKDDIAYRDIPKTGSSYTFNLTTAEMNVLRNATSGSSRTVKFFVRSIIGGVTYRSNLTRTFTIADGAPSLTCNVYDTNTTTVALTGDSSKFIKGFSNAYYSMSASAATGASITAYSCTNDGIRQNTRTGTFNKVNSAKFDFSVTDSRGNVTTQEVNKTLVDYFIPSYEIKANLSTEGMLTIVVSGSFYGGSFGAETNTVKLGIATWATDEEEPSTAGEYTPTVSGNTFSITLQKPYQDYGKTYIIYTHIVDKLVTVSNENYRVSSTPVFDWSKEDFNFNAPINMYGDTVLKVNKDANNTILAASGGSVYIRPKGVSDNSYEVKVGNTSYIKTDDFTVTADNIELNGITTINGYEFGGNRNLWTGGANFVMDSSTSINLSDSITNQAHGAILVFSPYINNAVYNADFFTFFVPKSFIEKHNGGLCTFVLTNNYFNFVGAKSIYIYDNKLVGAAGNEVSGTGQSGINYDNSRYVLRYVIGV